jgi:PAS domain S-box-containing protein
MTAQKPLQRHGRQRQEWAFLLGVLLLFGMYLGFSQYQDYQAVDAAQRQRLLQQTEVIESNLVPQIAAANQALQSVREDFHHFQEESDGAAQLNRRLQVFSDTLVGVRVMLVVNAQGVITASNNPSVIGSSVAHRAWFQAAAAGNNPGRLYMVEPIKTLINTFVMAMVRSMASPNGEFAGVVYASLDPASAKTVLDSVLYTPDAQSGLAHGTGILFMQEPERKDLAGKNLAVPGSLFTRHRDSGQSATVVADTVYATGEQRMIAQRTIWPDNLNMDQPLVVAVSRDLHAVFETWRRAALQEAGLFAFLSVAVSTMLWLYQRRQRLYAHDADQQEAALVSGHARLAEAQRIARVGSWELDLVNNVLVWSDEIFRLFEVDQRQFGATYEAFLDAIHPDDRAAVNQAYTDSLTSREPYEITHRLLMPDGRIKWVQERCTSDFDDQGRPLRSQGTVQDISEIHAAQTALQQLNAELESRVASRTQDLALAMQEALRLSAAKSDFLSHMSHELRTPLNAVIGFAQLLESDPDDPLTEPQRENVRDILQAGQHLLQLVNELLDLSRIESGNLALRLEAVDLAPLVGQCVVQVRTLAAQRGIVVRLDPVACDPVLVDPLRLRQVLLNLLANAIKYNRPDGSVLVQVTLVDGARVRLAVSDTGYGIAAQRLGELFQPFSRLGAERGPIEGAGIGLVITRHVVEQMGGRIGFESEVGVGSRFWVELPCAGIEPAATLETAGTSDQPPGV